MSRRIRHLPQPANSSSRNSRRTGHITSDDKCPQPLVFYFSSPEYFPQMDFRITLKTGNGNMQKRKNRGVENETEPHIATPSRYSVRESILLFFFKPVTDGTVGCSEQSADFILRQVVFRCILLAEQLPHLILGTYWIHYNKVVLVIQFDFK